MNPSVCAVMAAMVEAEVPPGMVAGSQFVVRAPDGSSVMVTLPPGLSVGDKFHVAIPDTYATRVSNLVRVRVPCLGSVTSLLTG